MKKLKSIDIGSHFAKCEPKRSHMWPYSKTPEDHIDIKNIKIRECIAKLEH